MAAFPEPPTFDLAAELADLRRSARPGRHGVHARTLVKQPDLRVVLVALEPGGRLAEHHAPGSITVQALEGRLRFGAAGRVVDLAAGPRAGAASGALWAYGGDELNANLVLLTAGEAIAAHVNAEVDVLLVGILGRGVVEVDDRRHALAAGQALVLPRGARRAIAGTGERFAYLTCHRRRAGLWPAGLPRPGAEPGRGR